jgi:hypothetical protein
MALTLLSVIKVVHNKFARKMGNDFFKLLTTGIRGFLIAVTPCEDVDIIFFGKWYGSWYNYIYIITLLK